MTSLKCLDSTGDEFDELGKEVLEKDKRLSCIKKEKSRDAARSRRGRENCEFYALATLLPIPDETSSQLDKASIIRLTMSFLQLRQLFDKCLVSTPSKSLDSHKYMSSFQLSLALQSLDGFLIVINSKGRCLYVSSSVSEDLGLAQVDLIGSDIFNVVLSSDHEELKLHLEFSCCGNSKKKFCQSYLKSKAPDSQGSYCSFFIRMKSTQAKRALGIKSSGYKVVHFTGHTVSGETAKSCSSDDEKNEEETEEEIKPFSGFAGLVRVLSHTPVEMSIDELVFVLRTNRGLLITYSDEQIKLLSNYDADEVKGQTIYQFIHFNDLNKIQTCHTEMLEKGHIVTPLYRWLLKDGTFMWVQSRGTLLQDKHHITDVEHSYSWITYVITNVNDQISHSLLTTENVDNSNNAIADRRISNCSPKGQSSVCANESPSSSHDDCPLDGVSGKLVKQHPQKSPPLKRIRSENFGEFRQSPEKSLPVSKVKRERKPNDDSPLPPTIRSSSTLEAAGTGSIHTRDVLDVHSTKWGNPPNREVANHSDLYTTVIHHHYPYGIDPNLLSSNPIFAKMLTTNYVTYESLASRDAFLFPPPAVNIFAPVLGTVPQLVSNQAAKLSYCPPSVASIVDELRQDPLRKVNPPNKVVLSRSHIPQPEHSRTTDKTAPVSSVPAIIAPINPHLLSLSNVTPDNLMLRPLATVEGQSSNSAIFLHPIELAHKVNSLNSLHI